MPLAAETGADARAAAPSKTPPRRILVTGAAGFIGAHAAAALAKLGHQVTGCDSFNAYYPPKLKRDRVHTLLDPLGVQCEALNLTDAGGTQALLEPGRFDLVLHLAAQAGVRHSIEAPNDTVQANLLGFANVIEACRLAGIPRFVYASSSSVYGNRTDMPFRERDRTARPASLYAATKLANEVMAHAYASVHGLHTTGLRFFTVYGPWGRPDMAYFSFARRMRRGEPIRLFAGGELLRDFTYIDDTVDAVVKLLDLPSEAMPADGVINIGHREPVRVIDFVRSLERATGLDAVIEHAPMQAGDVPATCADDSRLVALIGPWAHTSLDDGLARFARWLDAWEPQGAGPVGPR